MDLNNKIFASCRNSKNGDVDEQTRFHYHQKDNYIWGHYSGGRITGGVLLGQVISDSQITFEYQHFDQNGNYRTGTCTSLVKILPEGHLLLEEKWQWTNGDKSAGNSTLIEIKE